MLPEHVWSQDRTDTKEPEQAPSQESSVASTRPLCTAFRIPSANVRLFQTQGTSCALYYAGNEGSPGSTLFQQSENSDGSANEILYYEFGSQGNDRLKTTESIQMIIPWSIDEMLFHPTKFKHMVAFTVSMNGHNVEAISVHRFDVATKKHGVSDILALDGDYMIIPCIPMYLSGYGIHTIRTLRKKTSDRTNVCLLQYDFNTEKLRARYVSDVAYPDFRFWRDVLYTQSQSGLVLDLTHEKRYICPYCNGTFWNHYASET
jgi:hypothetical protein